MISHDPKRLFEVLMVLKDSNEVNKRYDKDLALLTPLISECQFFKKTMKMKDEDLLEICRHVSYERKEPGEMVYR